MNNLIAAAAAFILLHLLVSGTRAREAAVGALGEGGYMGLFSLASVGLLVWLGIAYGVARGAHGDLTYWSATSPTRWVQFFLQLIAVVFVVAGLTTRNPTAVGQSASASRPDVVQGMLRITRHPFLWGVCLWAIGHMLVSGHTAALIFFGAFLATALLGTVSIDAKRARALGGDWRGFADHTSNLPFAAIATGRQSLDIGEIGLMRLGGGVVLWLLLIGAHPHVFGANAIP
ncbi:MAG: NnrU family protein [Caulobacteraceae bacterium]